ncbi:MAG TPA: antibiotic biosynthesis monooxygenase [Clostridia bacterium]|nr:antibiotic biosynthesis monooxygenase [Clostridia bacterium]
MIDIVWEFQVREGREEEFEVLYSSSGIWARLFANDPAYRGTTLLRDADQTRRYLTIDRWTSRSEFQKFRQRSSSQYEAIDRQCENLTESEQLLGIFEAVG